MCVVYDRERRCVYLCVCVCVCERERGVCIREEGMYLQCRCRYIAIYGHGNTTKWLLHSYIGLKMTLVVTNNVVAM